MKLARHDGCRFTQPAHGVSNSVNALYEKAHEPIGWRPVGLDLVEAG